MNILFVTDLIPIDENENCARALVPIVKELMIENDVDIVRPNFLLNTFIRGKIIKPDGHYFFDGLKIKNMNFFLPFINSSKDIDINKYDIIISHMPSGILFAQSLLKRATKKIEWICAVHQSDIDVLTKIKYSLYFRSRLSRAYESCDRIVSRSHHLVKKIKKILPKCTDKVALKLSKIEDEAIISYDEICAKIDNSKTLRFITVANMIKRKNIHILLKALSNFDNNEFELLVLGDGKEYKNLKKLTKKLCLDNKVTFLGKSSREDVLAYMKSSNVFILPSENETFGLVYLEALANGCLCVGTKDTGADGLIIDNINGFLCEPTVEQLSKVIKKIFTLTNEDFKNLLKNRFIAY